MDNVVEKSRADRPIYVMVDRQIDIHTERVEGRQI